ncbi:protein GLUTAMINE DUMPER 1-like [Triticum urartu]|uniref:protein GLUTAMINE DUMPER 1-like n=1 Tax=Triticum urartu TaxID=4572 RepID=UPI0020443521|nr:protein GLUTAMINE DUMPER 1-like [Triticum urartu]
MRPGAEFVAMSHRAGAPMVAPAHGLINGTAPHSPWQSPVPYLFGGLAAMLGLIALALLILACSYWKLSGYLDGDRDGQESGGDGEKASASGASKPALDFQEHVVVIMAGDDRPTFLAKPATSRAVEVELAAAAAASASAVDEKEKKMDEQGCEVSSQLGGDPADAASGSSGHHHDHESSSTTGRQESLQ